MESLARKMQREQRAGRSTMTVETSLYDLIEAVQRNIHSTDDRLVAQALAMVFNKTRIRFMGDSAFRKVRLS